jgi:hypothetical protein
MRAPLLTTAPMPVPARLPLLRWPDVALGRVRWFAALGWCDQGLVDIAVGSVVEPTEEQIRLVEEIHPPSGNAHQVRQALQQGGFGLGSLLPEEAALIGGRLQELGLPFSYSPSPVWKPLNFERASGKAVTALRQF